MAVQIRKAVKQESKLRLALIGPAGSGKTLTSLLLASALAGEQGVIVIDTERGSASKYANQYSFDLIELESFSPESYIEAIHAAEEGGYGVLVIDSMSHEWAGPGGILEIVDGVARRNKGGNSFAAWGEVTPRHNRFIDAITRARLHVIVTMRSKQEYALDKDERTGRTTPRKVGLAPIQRDYVEYEMDIAAEMDIDHTMLVQKSRCPALANAVIARPGADLAKTLRDWLQGVSPAEVERAALVAQIASLRAAVGEAPPDPVGIEQATNEQLRKELTRLTTKHAEATC